MIDFTGLDDVSAVRARALDPPQDTCRAGDVEAVRAGTATSPRGRRSAATTAVARLAGLPLVGENPGGPGLAHTGGAPDSDGSADQLHHAPDTRGNADSHSSTGHSRRRSIETIPGCK